MAGTLGYSSTRLDAGELDLVAPAHAPAPARGRRQRRIPHPSLTGAATYAIPYLPGLDGLRALAVMSVLLYHGDVAALQGGFLGVEVFFVISGYLITSLLLAERRSTFRNDLRSFYARRARRLLPPLAAVLLLVMVIAVVFLPDEVATLRGDVGSSVLYVTNWFFVFSQKSYFETMGRPSLVQHLWSLAVEEQFYLLWPLIFTAGMRFLGRRKLFVAILAGVVASTALMAILYEPGVDPYRVYYGTDTRAAGLLIGAALAFVWAPYRLKKDVGAGAPVLLNVLGFTALAVLILQLSNTDQYADSLYYGGFLRVSLVTAVVIAVAVHPAAIFGKVLGIRPIRWVGLRSYGIYLYHWPIFQLTRPQLDTPLTGLPLLVLRLALTFAVATLSYKYLEMPIRRGALGRAWHTIRTAHDQRTRLARTRYVGGALALTATIAVVAVAAVRAEPAATPAYLLAGSTTHGELPPGPGDLPPPPTTARVTTTVPGTTPTAGAAPATGGPTDSAADPTASSTPPTSTAGDQAADPGAVPASDPATDPATGPTVGQPEAATVLRITAMGDSVMLGAASALTNNLSGATFVDARVSRQVRESLDILRQWRDMGLLGDVIVVHIGNNGTFAPEQMDEMRELLAGAPKVIFLTVKVPRGWEEGNNEIIRSLAGSMPNAVLVDWKALTDERPELFYDDGMHLRPEGAAYYAEVINHHVAPPA